MFLTFRYETDNKQILKLCPITVGFQLTQIFKWKVTLTSVMNMEKFCCLCNRSFNSGNIHRRSINSFSWYWLKYRNIEAKYWNLHAIILSNIIIGNTLIIFILRFVSHDTWNSYQSMLRILKKYKMPLRRSQKGEIVPGVEMSFR